MVTLLGLSNSLKKKLKFLFFAEYKSTQELKNYIADRTESAISLVQSQILTEEDKAVIVTCIDPGLTTTVASCNGYQALYRSLCIRMSDKEYEMISYSLLSQFQQLSKQEFKDVMSCLATAKRSYYNVKQDHIYLVVSEYAAQQIPIINQKSNINNLSAELFTHLFIGEA